MEITFSHKEQIHLEQMVLEHNVRHLLRYFRHS